MSVDPHAPAAAADRIARLEERLARLEAHVGLDAAGDAVTPPVSPALSPPRAVEEELELEVGQNWFALAGVVALTVGAGFMLALPYADLPASVPALAGLAATALVAVVAWRWQHPLETLAGYLRGAALVLLGFAALRLCFPAPQRVFDPLGFPGRAALLGAAAAGMMFALHRRSPWLLAMTEMIGAVLLLATGSAGLFLGGLVAFAIVTAVAAQRRGWPWLPVAAVPLLVLPYWAWALGNPFFARKLGFALVTPAGPLLLLAALVILAPAPRRDAAAGAEEASAKLGALVCCGFGYGTFLVTTLGAFPRGFAPLQACASLVLLALAAAAWHRCGSRVATFFYAMTGYGALTAAILELAPPPELFVWLSLQSVVVVATAVWFRSRLIVVANFFIYLAIVLGYMMTAGRETGISLGFGLVALVTARILNWQKERLTLQTELMRNACLACAFVVFPYALAHLVPARLVAVSWIALAAAYYAMNLVVTNRKYRWLAHGTLLLTAVQVVAAGTRQADPVYRTLSFLLLGAVLLGVSLAFTRARRRTAASSDPARPAS